MNSQVYQPSPQRVFSNSPLEKTISVLLVDDHLDERENLRQLLDAVYGDHMTVRACDTGLAAVELLRRERFDLVMIDNLLPDMDGLELVSEIADLADDTAVILMSSAPSDRVGADAIKRGARDYLIKQDLDPRDLEEAILEALRTARVEWRSSGLIRRLHETHEEMGRFVRTISTGMQANLRELERSLVAIKESCRTDPPETLAGEIAGHIARVERDLKHSQEMAKDLAGLPARIDSPAGTP
ncbi:MAG: response regulator [Planctomycetia bacterium]|nr:response regulator [Planctomycetia bacterium]